MTKLDCTSLQTLMFSVTAAKGTGIYHTDQGRWRGGCDGNLPSNISHRGEV